MTLKKHIFLTGKKQIGKSTIIRNYLAAHPCFYSGFLTVKTQSVYPNALSVHMLTYSAESYHLPAIYPEKNKKPSKENFLFFCGRNSAPYYLQYDLTPDPVTRFNRIGCDLLSNIPKNTDLIIMDEIGPHEQMASAFCDAISHCLDGNIPILGVLQQTETSLFQNIANHPSVKLITVTTENRENISLFSDL